MPADGRSPEISAQFLELSRYVTCPLRITGFFPVVFDQNSENLRWHPQSRWVFFSAILLICQTFSALVQIYHQDVITRMMGSSDTTSAVSHEGSTRLLGIVITLMRVLSLVGVKKRLKFFQDHVKAVEILTYLHPKLCVCLNGRYLPCFNQLRKLSQFHICIILFVAISYELMLAAEMTVSVVSNSRKWQLVNDQLHGISLTMYLLSLSAWLFFPAINAISAVPLLFFPKLYTCYLELIAEEFQNAQPSENVISRVKFKNLCQAVYVIEKLAAQFNDVYGMDCITLLTESYIGTVITAFTLRTYFVYATQAPIGIMFLMAVAFSLQLIFILHNASIVSTALKKLRNVIFSKSQQEEQVEDEVTLLFLQLSLDPPVLCPTGVCTLNRNVITATFSSIITYLLILIQFQISEK